MEEIIPVFPVEGVKLNFQVAKLGEVGDLRVWEEGVCCKKAQRLKPGTKRFTVTSNVRSDEIIMTTDL